MASSCAFTYNEAHEPHYFDQVETFLEGYQPALEQVMHEGDVEAPYSITIRSRSACASRSAWAAARARAVPQNLSGLGTGARDGRDFALISVTFWASTRPHVKPRRTAPPAGVPRQAKRYHAAPPHGALGGFSQSAANPELPTVGTAVPTEGGPARLVGCSPAQQYRTTYRGGQIFRGGNISLWEISYFKCVRNFPLKFQATARNKPGAKFSHWGGFSLPLCSLAFELLSVGRGWRRPRNPDSLPGWRVSIRPQSAWTSRGGGKAPGTQGSGSGIKESQRIRELVFVVPQSR